MIYKRVIAGLRAQNWSAIAIELAIVVIGVFIGTQVSNWNANRLERAETVEVLRSLAPELRNLTNSITIVGDYYSVTRRYADTAFAGWRGDERISDRAFVIAAYQASQNTYIGVTSGSWAEIFGGDRLRTLKDQGLRNELSVLMTTDFAALERELFSEYRVNVRKVIPEDIQDAIRAQCGDRRIDLIFIPLRPTCRLDLPEARFAAAARDLRANPQLVGELRWHFAAVASYVENIDNLANTARSAVERMKEAG